MPDTDASKLDPDRALRKRIAAIWASMTPDEIEAMMKAQRESFIRAMAPCEHGDPDWETCPQCRGNAQPTAGISEATQRMARTLGAEFVLNRPHANTDTSADTSTDTPAEPEPLSEQEAGDAFFAIVRALDSACCAGASTITEVADGGITIQMHYSAERCRKWIEREREAAMTELAALGQELDASEPDQDTLDLRSLFAAYDTVSGPWFMAGCYDDGPSFERAKAALAAIKDRVRREEREAVCKWLRAVCVWGGVAAYDQFADAIAGGEHRDTRT